MKMKMKIKIILGLLALINLNSCSSDDQIYKYQLDYMSFKNEDSDDEYGLIGKNGIIFSQKFENAVGPVVNGYFSLEEEDGYTLCKINGNSYEKLANANGYAKIGVMNDGLIPVCKHDEHIQVLDTDGNIKYTLAQVDSIDVWNCYSYSCGKMRVLLNNEKYVYVDSEGHNAFNKAYDWASDFDNGYAVVGIGDDKYQLITDNGEPLFSFVCEDAEEIVFSTKYQKLSAKNDNEIFSVSDFNGKVTHLPKMVEGIVVLLEDDFIFKNDYNYGLMSYDNCRDKIYAKYDQLVPNGKYYLGISEDNDEVVKLLDSNGVELGTFDGEEIISPIQYGYDFPNIIKRPDDRIFLIDEKGQMIGHAENFDFDIDDVKDAAFVHNMFFPTQQIDNMIISLCGDGTGVPNGEGAFFYKDGSHCHPYEISYFKNSTNLDQFKGNYIDQQLVEEGVNYYISLSYKFDEPIVHKNSDSLSTSAWLQYIEIKVATTNIFYEIATYNRIKNLLIDKGCTELYSYTNGCILRSSNSENILVFQHVDTNQFTIRMSNYSESSVESWRNSLANKK